MPVLKDLICGVESCDHILLNRLSTDTGMKCPKCRVGIMETYFGNWGHARDAAAINAKDAVVVFEDPKTGAIAYPGRNDKPMPERYRQRGYIRKEMRSLSEIDRFSKQHGLVNEASHYDRGSGRSYDQ